MSRRDNNALEDKTHQEDEWNAVISFNCIEGIFPAQTGDDICYIRLENTKKTSNARRASGSQSAAETSEHSAAFVLAKPLQPILQASSVIEMLAHSTVNKLHRPHDSPHGAELDASVVLSPERLLERPCFIARLLAERNRDVPVEADFPERGSNTDCVDDIHSSGQVKRTERQGGLNIEHCFQPETWKAFFQLVTSGQLVDDDVQQEQYRDSRSVFVPTLLHTLVENTNLLNEECHNSLPRLPMGSGQLMITTLPEYVARTMLSAALQNAADCRKKLNFCEVVNPGAAAPPASSYVILAMARSTGAFLINVCDVMHHLVGASRFCSQEYRSAMSNATDTGMRVAHHLLVLGWALKLSWKLRQRLCQELKHFENVAEEVLNFFSTNENSNPVLRPIQEQGPASLLNDTERFTDVAAKLQKKVERFCDRLTRAPFNWDVRLAGKVLVLAHLLDCPSVASTALAFIMQLCQHPFLESPQLYCIFADLSRSQQLYCLEVQFCRNLKLKQPSLATTTPLRRTEPSQPKLNSLYPAPGAFEIKPSRAATAHNTQIDHSVPFNYKGMVRDVTNAKSEDYGTFDKSSSKNNDQMNAEWQFNDERGRSETHQVAYGEKINLSPFPYTYSACDKALGLTQEDYYGNGSANVSPRCEQEQWEVDFSRKCNQANLEPIYYGTGQTHMPNGFSQEKPSKPATLPQHCRAIPSLATEPSCVRSNVTELPQKPPEKTVVSASQPNALTNQISQPQYQKQFGKTSNVNVTGKNRLRPFAKVQDLLESRPTLAQRLNNCELKMQAAAEKVQRRISQTVCQAAAARAQATRTAKLQKRTLPTCSLLTVKKNEPHQASLRENAISESRTTAGQTLSVYRERLKTGKPKAKPRTKSPDNKNEATRANVPMRVFNRRGLGTNAESINATSLPKNQHLSVESNAAKRSTATVGALQRTGLIIGVDGSRSDTNAYEISSMNATPTKQLSTKKSVEVQYCPAPSPFPIHRNGEIKHESATKSKLYNYQKENFNCLDVSDDEIGEASDFQSMQYIDGTRGPDPKNVDVDQFLRNLGLEECIKSFSRDIRRKVDGQLTRREMDCFTPQRTPQSIVPEPDARNIPEVSFFFSSSTSLSVSPRAAGMDLQCSNDWVTDSTTRSKIGANKYLQQKNQVNLPNAASDLDRFFEGVENGQLQDVHNLCKNGTEKTSLMFLDNKDTPSHSENDASASPELVDVDLEEPLTLKPVNCSHNRFGETEPFTPGRPKRVDKNVQKSETLCFEAMTTTAATRVSTTQVSKKDSQRRLSCDLGGKKSIRNAMRGSEVTNVANPGATQPAQPNEVVEGFERRREDLKADEKSAPSPRPLKLHEQQRNAVVDKKSKLVNAIKTNGSLESAAGTMLGSSCRLLKRLQRSKAAPPVSNEEKMKRKAAVWRRREEFVKKERQNFLSRFARQTSALHKQCTLPESADSDVIILARPMPSGSNVLADSKSNLDYRDENLENTECFRPKPDENETRLQTTTAGDADVCSGKPSTESIFEPWLPLSPQDLGADVCEEKEYSTASLEDVDQNVSLKTQCCQPLNEDEAFDYFIEQNSIL